MQVLSGFANGVFLVFISFYVLMESVERLMEPPDVKTDRLLLVSVLGFLVSILPYTHCQTIMWSLKQDRYGGNFFFSRSS